jgi:hypothetical protein
MMYDPALIDDCLGATISVGMRTPLLLSYYRD